MSKILLLSLIMTSTWAAMPTEAQNLLDREGMQELAAKSEFDAKVAKIRKEAVPKLQALLDAATKKGDLEGALAIKAKMAEIAPTKDEKPAPVDLKQRLTGTFEYDFHNGHKGQLEVRGGIATEVRTNIQGPVNFAGGTATIEWANGTQWKVSAKDDGMEAQASDGTSTLTATGAQAKR